MHTAVRTELSEILGRREVERLQIFEVEYTEQNNGEKWCMKYTAAAQYSNRSTARQ
jgi:hypothetical protein